MTAICGTWVALRVAHYYCSHRRHVVVVVLLIVPATNNDTRGFHHVTVLVPLTRAMRPFDRDVEVAGGALCRGERL